MARVQRSLNAWFASPVSAFEPSVNNQLFYSIRSERLMEQLDYSLLFRWFVGLSMDEPIWAPTVFTKNRDRLLNHEIARSFFRRVVDRARALMSDEHFTVDGTLIEAWASQKSFQRKDGDTGCAVTATYRNASPIVGKEHQDEQEAVEAAVGTTKSAATTGDVILQEGAPSLRWRLSLAHHVVRDSGLTDVDPEFQEFAMNPRRALVRVRVRHRANHRADVGGHGRSAHTAPGLPRPPYPEAPSVPGDDGLRLDDDERRSPAGPDV